MMSSSPDELLTSRYAVVVRQLRVIRGKATVLHDLDLTVSAGTITGLLGPSGCGKTTLMRCIVGTQKLTGGSGSVEVLGHSAGSRELRHRVGYVTQNPTVYADLKVIDNVRYFAALYGSPASSAPEAVGAVGLEDQRDSLCADLSGGQLSRVSLACALVGAPELLVLDEPTVGLDPVLRVDLWDRFNDLARGGTTLLISSHVMDEADRCGELLLMREGRLLAHTTPARLREDTRCNSLEDAFLSIIKQSTAA